MKDALNISQIQNACCGILNFLKEVCDKHEIKYYLAFGTCLGAVRHNGFIPWDDDVDIYMYRDDYSRFSKIMSEIYHNNRYKLYYYDITPEYQQPLPKLCDTETVLIESSYNQCPIGVYVDVFILDRVPENIDERLLFFENVNKMYRGWSIHYSSNMYIYKKYGFLTLIKHLVRTLIHKDYTAKDIDIFCQKYAKSSSRVVGNMTETVYSCDKVCMYEDMLGDGVEMPFEGVNYRIPSMYDKYLIQLYRDYMTLPPEDKRVYHSANIAYYK